MAMASEQSTVIIIAVKSAMLRQPHMTQARFRTIKPNCLL